jgi:hypothetical protein
LVSYRRGSWLTASWSVSSQIQSSPTPVHVSVLLSVVPWYWAWQLAWSLQGFWHQQKGWLQVVLCWWLARQVLWER